MTDGRLPRLLRSFASLGISVPLISATPVSLESIPFWRDSEGCWLSQNHYLDPAMEPNIPIYASVTCIEVQAEQVIERETKFYPASKLADGYGGDLVRKGEGVEVINLTVAIAAGTGGVVRNGASAASPAAAGPLTLTTPISEDSAMVTVRNQGQAADNYRMFITMPTIDHRYFISLGLVSEPEQQAGLGNLRGFAFFKQRRIQKDKVAYWHDCLRKRFAIAIRVTTSRSGTVLRERTAGGSRAPEPRRDSAACPEEPMPSQ